MNGSIDGLAKALDDEYSKMVAAMGEKVLT